MFLDSPMAISATDIMRRHPECFERWFSTLTTKQIRRETHRSTDAELLDPMPAPDLANRLHA